jgi:endonuclease/exonuclease/phosphatase family metal-dependent hydrolase
MGNESVIAVTITSDVNICLINAYLPTQGPYSQFEDTECLEIIVDIIDKHHISYKSILCGDLNGTLLDSRSSKHDKLLKEFVSETKLYYDKERNNKPTFYHHAQTSTSKIDYVLVSDNKMCTNYLILDNDESINTSAHRAVIMRTNISIPTVPKKRSSGEATTI